MKIKTLIPHSCLVVALAWLTGCGPLDEGELQRQEQAVYDPCLCMPGSPNCPPPECKPPPKPISYCGDGILGRFEECDKTALGGETCASLGYGGGTLSCNADCTFDTSSCDPCGNGALDPGEACDGSNLGGKTCVSLGFAGGTLACSSSCAFDTSGCTTICGDGLVQGNEQCDGASLAGATCASIGYRDGVLGCTSSCTFDLSGCEKCGDGIVNGLEQCDGTGQTLPTCQSNGYQGGTVSCGATCEYDWSNCVEHYYAEWDFIWEWVDGWNSTHYIDAPEGPLCGLPTLIDAGWATFCDQGDLCIDPNTMLCGRYVAQAAGQVYTPGGGGDGTWCGYALDRGDLPAFCGSGDVCTSWTKLECTRQ